MICFKYEHRINQLVKQIESQTCCKDTLYSNTIISRVRGDRIILVKKRLLQHPLQRKFTGQLFDFGDQTIMIGRFQYPRFASLIYILIMAMLLYNNLEVVFSNIDIAKKLAITGIFLAMQVIFVLFFVTGVTFFKKQENEVVEFLSEI